MNFNELPGLSQTQMEEWYHQAVAPNSSRLREGAIAKLEPKFVSCDFQAGEAVMEYKVLEWELNPQSMVHGGIIITGFDTSLGDALPLLRIPQCTDHRQPVLHVRSPHPYG